MGDGTKENPYTREDVLRLIRARGGNTEKFDLSDKWFEKGIDLRGRSGGSIEGMLLKGIDLRKAHLEGADLTLANLEKADLREANLEGANLGFASLEEANLTVANLNRAYIVDANLRGAKLQECNLESANLFESNLEGTDLRMANLNGAILVSTNLEGANFELASLKKANLVWARFSADTDFAGADWGDYIMGEERKGDFDLARESYWRLRHWHTEAGLYDIAAKFYYREKEAARKGAKRWRDRYALQLFRFLFGYGERWWNIAGWIAGFILLFGLIYFGIATFAPSVGTLDPSSFLDSLYFSAVSFIAIGYGSWIKDASGLIKYLGVLETFLGFFLITLLLVTFVRKWTR